MPTLPEPGEPLEIDCRLCAGSGRTPNPAWDAWRKKKAQAEAEGAPMPRPPFHPEDAPCRGCDGLGRVPTGPGAQVLDFVKRHLPR